MEENRRSAEEETDNGNRRATTWQLPLSVSLALLLLAGAACRTQSPGVAPPPPESRVAARVSSTSDQPATSKSDDEKIMNNRVKAEASSEATIADIALVVRRVFGAEIKVETARRPFYLLGDFNGDGSSDIAVVVRTKGGTKNLGQGIVVLNPWQVATQAQNPVEESADEAAGEPAQDTSAAASTLALAVIHGAKGGWNRAQPLAGYLLLDAVYDELRIHEEQSRSTLLSDRSLKGDAIYTGTEDAGGVIYWDGKTYRWIQHGD